MPLSRCKKRRYRFVHSCRAELQPEMKKPRSVAGLLTSCMGERHPGGIARQISRRNLVVTRNLTLRFPGVKIFRIRFRLSWARQVFDHCLDKKPCPVTFDNIQPAMRLPSGGNVYLNILSKRIRIVSYKNSVIGDIHFFSRDCCSTKNYVSIEHSKLAQQQPAPAGTSERTQSPACAGCSSYGIRPQAVPGECSTTIAAGVAA